MHVLKENVSYETIIRKSRFICFLIAIDNEEDIEENLTKLKNEYKNATHYCYAYVLKNKQKYNDDKEPSGTAGVPILDILLKNNLTNVLAVVIRYFGGIKLGAGGLVRAYSNAVVETLKLANIIEYKEYSTILFETDYENTKRLEYLLKDYEIVEKKFDNKVVYKIRFLKENKDKIEKILTGFNTN